MTYNNDANKIVKPKDIQDQVNLLIYSNNSMVADVRKMTKQISELYELDEERREHEAECLKTEIEMLKNQASERKAEIDALKARLNREQTKDETDG